MLDWLKNINKEHPEFWKTYLSKFDQKSKRYVVFTTETSGLNPEKDVILSMGSFAIQNNKIYIGDSFESTLLQNKYYDDNGLSNEFILESKMKKLSELEAIEGFIDYIGNAVLIGHHVDFDVDMINHALIRLDCGRLKNEALDIDVMYRKLEDINDKEFSLDELSEIFKLPKNYRNSTSEDAYTIALLFLKLKKRLGIK
jgi:DNA polymerase III subunit epsilon